MPNWAHSRIEIEGAKEVLDEIIKTIEVLDDDGKFADHDLSRVKPMPEVVKNTESPAATSPEPNENWVRMLANGEMTQEWFDELCENNRKRYEGNQKALAETGYTDWYNWAVANWGTKWAPEVADLIRNDGNIVIHTNSAWSPPIGILKALTEAFDVTVTCSYEEEGMGFVGACVLRKGEFLFDECYDFEPESLPEPFSTRLSELSKKRDEEDEDEFYEKMSDIYMEVSDYLWEKTEKVEFVS